MTDEGFGFVPQEGGFIDQFPVVQQPTDSTAGDSGGAFPRFGGASSGGTSTVSSVEWSGWNVLALKSKTIKGEKSYQGYYQGAFAGLMTVLAYSAFVYYKDDDKEGKTVDAQPFLSSDEDFALV